MRKASGLVSALALAFALAGCAQTTAPPQAALPTTTGDPLADAAALLLAAEEAGDAKARAPVIDRLDAMRVSVIDGAEDDPLSAWRADHESAAGPVYRGRTLGPAYRRARLSPGQTIHIEQIFYAGERAELVAQTNGGNVALAVNNPRAEPVCAKPLAPSANCQWLPIFTERFSIELKNHGSNAASVYIVFR